MKLTKLSYVLPFHAEGHDPGCGAHSIEACDCVSGIVRSIKLAFAADLNRIAGRAALKDNTNED